jgi:hypothetical protein
VSYTEQGPKGFTTHNKSEWSVNSFWTGGYENECRWYAKVLQIYEVPALEVISTALGLVFGVLAIGVKLTIVGRIKPTVVPEPLPSEPGLLQDLGGLHRANGP